MSVELIWTATILTSDQCEGGSGLGGGVLSDIFNINQAKELAMDSDNIIEGIKVKPPLRIILMTGKRRASQAFQVKLLQMEHILG